MIHLLPALPAAWPSGSFRGLRARGGLEVDLTWKDGHAMSATLTTSQDGPIILIPPRGQAVAGVSHQGKPAGSKLNPDGSALIQIKSGDSYVVGFETRK